MRETFALKDVKMKMLILILAYVLVNVLANICR